MADLSDVIGKAIGGERGKLVDKMIDALKVRGSLGASERYTDEDVIVALVYSSVYKVVDPYPVSDTHLREALELLRQQIVDLKGAGYRITE